MQLKSLIISAHPLVHSTFELSISLHQKTISERHPTKRNYSTELEFYCCRYIGVAFNKMKKGGPVLRQELGDISYLEAHSEVCQLFKDAGCYRFCENIQGSHQ